MLRSPARNAPSATTPFSAPARKDRLDPPGSLRHARTAMNERFLAAAVQLCATADKEANFERAARLARVAAQRGATLIVLPEVWSWRGPRDQERAAAEPVPGPTTARLAALAAELRVYL